MSTDPVDRLPGVFGNLVQKSRVERKWTLEQFSNATGMHVTDLKSMEDGKREPTLTEFFKIASAMRSPPGILMIDLIADWRGDSTFDPIYKSRPSEFSRVYRLGYYHDPGDFREHASTYNTVDDATKAARELNPARQNRGAKLFNTVSIYIRMGYVPFDWRADREQ
jgi:transcriptional regulator with XRE-family HTH domain